MFWPRGRHRQFRGLGPFRTTKKTRPRHIRPRAHPETRPLHVTIQGKTGSHGTWLLDPSKRSRRRLSLVINHPLSGPRVSGGTAAEKRESCHVFGPVQDHGEGGFRSPLETSSSHSSTSQYLFGGGALLSARNRAHLRRCTGAFADSPGLNHQHRSRGFPRGLWPVQPPGGVARCVGRPCPDPPRHPSSQPPLSGPRKKTRGGVGLQARGRFLHS